MIYMFLSNNPLLGGGGGGVVGGVGGGDINSSNLPCWIIECHNEANTLIKACFASANQRHVLAVSHSYIVNTGK